MVPSVWLLINDHVASDLRGEGLFPERFAVRLVYHFQLSAGILGFGRGGDVDVAIGDHGRVPRVLRTSGNAPENFTVSSGERDQFGIDGPTSIRELGDGVDRAIGDRVGASDTGRGSFPEQFALAEIVGVEATNGVAAYVGRRLICAKVGHMLHDGEVEDLAWDRPGAPEFLASGRVQRQDEVAGARSIERHIEDAVSDMEG